MSVKRIVASTRSLAVAGRTPVRKPSTSSTTSSGCQNGTWCRLEARRNERQVCARQYSDPPRSWRLGHRRDARQVPAPAQRPGHPGCPPASSSARGHAPSRGSPLHKPAPSTNEPATPPRQIRRVGVPALGPAVAQIVASARPTFPDARGQLAPWPVGASGATCTGHSRPVRGRSRVDRQRVMWAPSGRGVRPRLGILVLQLRR
jgi:hypothetical protein